ncbi:MAG: peptidylprolyl isomerase [Lachnospiraceae bacterium]|nr:peptidylprolyl isomerase [Lachnospiraceae bacterium]
MIGCILLILTGMLVPVACRSKDTRVVFTKGFAKDEVFRIEDETCRLPEIMVYLTTIQNQYESVYGEQIWDVSLDGVTLEENIKDTVLARIAQVKTMYLLAKDRGVTLDAQEAALVERAADEYYASLNKTEIAQMQVSKETVQGLYEEYALAQKVYRILIADINPEISDDEARTITVQHILLRTYTVNGSGKKTAYTDEAKAVLYQRAQEIREQAVAGDVDFAELASRYSEDANITYYFGKGDLDPAFEAAAFQLETNEISDVVESESGYHIIKCLSTFNREETDANKVKLVEKRRKEAVAQEYDAFVETLARDLNHSLWDEVELLHDDGVTTDNFFQVYEKYFPQDGSNGTS